MLTLGQMAIMAILPWVGALVLVLLLTGCVGPSVLISPAQDRDTYTRGEVDAITLAAQCRALARTQVEVARCGVGP